MSPDPRRPGSARPATIVNEEIRALWQHIGARPTSAAERAQYEQLVVEWAAAVRAERLDEAA